MMEQPTQPGSIPVGPEQPVVPPTAPVVLQDRPRDSPDPGTRRSGLIAVIATLVLVGTVALLQQLGAVASSEPEQQREGVVAPAKGDQFTLMTGMLVKIANAFKGVSGGMLDPINASQLTRSITDSAQTPVEKFRAAVACAEVEGVELLDSRLTPLEPELDYEGASGDIETLRTIAQSGAASLSDQQRADLVERHGYFGRLALTLGLPDTDPARRPYTQGGWTIILFTITLFVGLVIVALVSLALCIVAIVKFRRGAFRPAFLPPLRGGSVFLEMVALMAGAFLLIKILGGVIASALTREGHGPPEWLEPISLSVQWLILPVLFWPLLRGMSFQELRRRIGWTSGRGVMREIGAGLFAYFASLPFLVLAMLITLLAMVLFSLVKTAIGDKLPPPENPVFELLGAGNPLTLVLLFLMATVWAPIVEEGVFRGALYRHLRGGWGVVASAIVSAIMFGFMHGYMILMLLPVITLGFFFALMREWRGSLIAPMTAHALHNATVLTIAITAVTLLRPE